MAMAKINVNALFRGNKDVIDIMANVAHSNIIIFQKNNEYDVVFLKCNSLLVAGCSFLRQLPYIKNLMMKTATRAGRLDWLHTPWSKRHTPWPLFLEGKVRC